MALFKRLFPSPPSRTCRCRLPVQISVRLARPVSLVFLLLFCPATLFSRTGDGTGPSLFSPVQGVQIPSRGFEAGLPTPFASSSSSSPFTDRSSLFELPPHPLILLCGPPCSGKGSLASLLCRRLSLSHVSTGDLLRQFLRGAGAPEGAEKREDELGSKKPGEDPGRDADHAHTHGNAADATQALQSGKLVSDTLILQLLHREMERLSAEQGAQRGETTTGENIQESEQRKLRGVVLEGFPRTAEQVDMLYAINCKPDAIVCLDVDDAVLFERLGGRLIDPETAQVYGAANPPPEAIRHRLVRRADDTQAVLAMRIEVYRQSWREISRRLRRHAQWGVLEPSERAPFRGGQAGGHLLTRALDAEERRNAGREAGPPACQELSTQEEEANEALPEAFAAVDAGRDIEEVYADVVEFLRKKFGAKVVEKAE
ncbi:putative adenylate kinase [Neospora caninum Liverpool]|uniref:Putative adenylate kinase n=1 Tax=Neospora caninum (strain Liverpool) TaxID=572307 RepID=F0VH04_NEOCL|nr:putative adenylate kinase [Neospora caninum Liverpool]CBZ52998.1 putative adenylate kinase [Neospora caninum Liverpool]|eukprot:XP_003883030.1 putative adenylate kinase [Neospora caninum Liverpool]